MSPDDYDRLYAESRDEPAFSNGRRRNGRRAVPPELRFWAKVTEGPVPAYRPELGPCWLWNGRPNEQGYGRFRSGGEGSRTVPAHCWSYEHLVADVPGGLVLDHLCRVRHCVNPYHLDPVTDAVNLLRGESFSAVNAAKTECPDGHPYSPENTYIHPTTGARLCLTCKRRSDRTGQARRRAAQRVQRSAV